MAAITQNFNHDALLKDLRVLLKEGIDWTNALAIRHELWRASKDPLLVPHPETKVELADALAEVQRRLDEMATAFRARKAAEAEARRAKHSHPGFANREAALALVNPATSPEEVRALVRHFVASEKNLNLGAMESLARRLQATPKEVIARAYQGEGAEFGQFFANLPQRIAKARQQVAERVAAKKARSKADRSKADENYRASVKGSHVENPLVGKGKNTPRSNSDPNRGGRRRGKKRQHAKA